MKQRTGNRKHKTENREQKTGIDHEEEQNQVPLSLSFSRSRARQAASRHTETCPKPETRNRPRKRAQTGQRLPPQPSTPIPRLLQNRHPNFQTLLNPLPETRNPKPGNRKHLFTFPTPHRKVDVWLPGKGNSNPHGARPIHQIITMMKWSWASRLSINKSRSTLRRCSRSSRRGWVFGVRGEELKAVGKGLWFRSMVQKKSFPPAS